MARIIAGLTWVALLVVAFGFAPPSHPETGSQVVSMLTWKIDGINPCFAALFNMMGLLPMVFLGVLAFDSKEQRVPWWPFVLGSFALGAFALGPYLILRQWGLPTRPADTWWRRLLAHRAYAIVVLLGSVAVGAWFLTGDFAGFVEQFKREQFPFVMSFDFLACTVVVGLLGFEAARRDARPILFWSTLPVVGGALLVSLRKTTAAASE
jgi:hypothetical protein